MVAPRQPLGDFLAELLAEQGQLQTPVTRFSAAPKREPTYRDLIPLTKPSPGEQYAFEVDLDSCSGCKACVVACHALNGLEDDESWRDVGLIHGGSHAAPFQQTVTTACHHCADPGCLNGCPVLAYEKDPITGIVRHLDDQCIGCQYCILKCPYDVPKYSERLGIVRKCDMCHNRLAEGEAPACVQACPTEAIKIIKIEIHVGAAVRVDTSAFLPGAPDPAYTQPTTRYISRQPLPENAAAADGAALRPQPPHWPLVALLMLMPMAVGCGVADKVLDLKTPALAVCGWVAGAAGLGLAALHLGQPLRAWKVFLNLRRSWFSREAVVFGLWFPLASAYVAVRLGWLPLAAGPLRSSLAVGTALLGTLGLFCSVMIYADTQRAFWCFANTAPRFFGTAVILGLAGALIAPGAPLALGYLLAAATALKLAFEARALTPIQEEDDGPYPPARQTARLLVGPLRPVNELRAVAGLLGGILVPLMVATGSVPPRAAWLALGLTLLGELAERYLFFRAVDAPKMPGSVRS
ncbi:DmsC/YnfH family molybdoenzyme membrane anchor subunit [Opitutus sp. GAS368]|jgi:formate dehydrogenase iron-sulfur subunit|uniref:DmsC/YnfH family molybdoenzyme membrane anchor subunit n=1 Tax=Opitutus sp. GAS368 TaxID=1882749 RepID=UPI00087BEE1D|nr:DmsC/YnfH family molybdoenzyme membrane anchor subunit [Opitutus sp. GAS368]SDR66117.1 nitrate reductase (quinol-dependent), transmembrane subunit [Opitutus sp. GAS368]